MTVSFSIFALSLLAFLGLKNPLLMCLLLILMSISLSSLFNLVMSKWLCYAVILIFLGGMMIVFLYVSTMSLNQKIFFNFLNFPSLLSSILLITGLSIWAWKMNQPGLLSHIMLISSFFGSLSSPLILFLILFLLFALISVVSMAESFKGTIHKPW